MRFAYADPPYLGQAHRYGEAEVDHALLIAMLASHFPDGWALSCSTPSLRTILPLCPESTRILAWCKSFAAFKANVPLAYTWEPVLLCGGRRRSRAHPTVRDYCVAGITLERGFLGAKPDAFAMWLFEAAGLEPSDDFVDVFPGSGAVSRAWEAWTLQRPLPFAKTA